ncbi:thioredoxin-like protein [Cladochytrium replicatum]|nr:thioredoxin-like protein [Cladochytrium replicatum]
MEDTEWNDILRQKGIIPPQPKELEITEDEIEAMVDQAIAQKYGPKDPSDMTVDELDELLEDDDEDAKVILEYRKQRLAEMQNYAARARFGAIREISKPDYATEVTEASKNVWVVLHLYQSHVPASQLLGAHLTTLARKYPTVKFLSIVADRCIENYPDNLVPTMLVYGNGELTVQAVGLAAITGRKAPKGVSNAAWKEECSLREVEKYLDQLGTFTEAIAPKTGKDDDDEEEEVERKRFGFKIRNGERKEVADDDWD